MNGGSARGKLELEREGKNAFPICPPLFCSVCHRVGVCFRRNWYVLRLRIVGGTSNPLVFLFWSGLSSIFLLVVAHFVLGKVGVES